MTLAPGAHFVAEVVAELLGERQGQNHLWPGMPGDLGSCSACGDPKMSRDVSQKWMSQYGSIEHY